MTTWRSTTSNDWPDLAVATDAAGISERHTDVLLRHVAEHLVGSFGVEHFEAYRGKEGQQIFAVEEVAAAVVAKLAPTLAVIAPERLDELIASGELGRPLRHPWEMTN